MTILFNGKSAEVEEGMTVTALLDSRGYGGKKVSVWLDGRQLLTKEYDSTQLTQGCTIKVLRILGGG